MANKKPLIRRVVQSRAFNIVIITVIICLPLLYAGLLTWTYEKPIDNLNQVDAAVVNLDHSATQSGPQGDEKRSFNIGKELVDRLTEKDADAGFRWHLTDADAAKAGLEDGKYLAVLTIPADVSSSVSKLDSADATTASAAKLELTTNDGVSYLAGTMAISVANELQGQVRENANIEITKALVQAIGKIHNQLGEAASGADKLADGNQQLAEGSTALAAGNGQLATGANKLAAGTGTLASGAKQLAAGTTELAHGAGALSSGNNQLASGTTTLLSGAKQLDQGAKALALGNLKLAQGSRDLSTGSRQLHAGSTQLSTGAQRLDAGSSALAAGTQQLADGLGQLKSQSSTLPAQAQALNAGAQKLSASAQALSTGAKSVQAGVDLAVSALSQAQTVSAQVASLLTPQNLASLQQLSGTQTQNSLGQLQSLLGGLAQVCQLAQDDQTASQTKAAVTQLCTQAGGASKISAAGAQLGKLKTGLAQLQNTLGKLANIQLPANDPAAAAKLQELKAGAAQLSQGAAQLSGGAGQLAAGTQRLSTAAPVLQAAIVKAAEGAGQVNTGAQQVAAGSKQLYTASVQLTDGSGKVLSGAQALATGAGSAASGAKQLAAGTSSAVSGAGQLQAGAAAAASGANKLASGAATAATGANKLASGTVSADQGAKQLAAGADSAASGANKLATGAASAADGSAQLSTALTNGAAQVPNYDAQQRDQIAQTAAKAVSVDAVRANPVKNNGSGFAPLFLSLAMWIGGIATYFIFPALDKRRPGESWWACALRSFGVGLAVGIAQALVAALVVGPLIGATGVKMIQLMGILVLCALAFIAFNQALLALLGFRGRFFSVLLLVLQIASSGATFPIATAPGFMQAISPWLPMTHTAAAIRTVAAGAGLSIWPAIGFTVVTLVGSVAVTLASAYATRNQSEPNDDPTISYTDSSAPDSRLSKILPASVLN